MRRAYFDNGFLEKFGISLEHYYCAGSLDKVKVPSTRGHRFSVSSITNEFPWEQKKEKIF